MNNVFDNPKKYLKELNNTDFFNKSIIEEKKKKFEALSLACVWPTKLCPLGCETCFFRSSMNHKSLELEEYQFSNKGLTKLIKFINDSNNGYLMLSGGGDPLICPDIIERMIKEINSKRIIVITSGFWARTEASAKKIIDNLYNAIQNRKYKNCGHVVLRISIDAYHRKQIGGNDSYKNIIKVFEKYYSNNDDFSLLFHSIKNDTVVEEIAKEMNAALQKNGTNQSDNKYVTKIMVQSSEFILNNYKFTVSYSKLFNSDVMVNLLDDKIVQENMNIIKEDMKSSEQNNPTYVLNASGKKGLDYWVNYNGNVTSWMNQDPDRIFNVYKDSYKKFVKETLNNPMSLFLMEKGYPERNKIISEVNSLAVIRAEAVNIRDYYATLLLRERHTKLYYYIRTIQYFIKEKMIDKDKLDNLSCELKKAILGSTNNLKRLYDTCDYDILKQELNERSFDKEVWLDWFALIVRGHYNVNKERLNNKLNYFYKVTGLTKDETKILSDYSEKRYNRISETMSPIDKHLLLKIVKSR